MFTGASSGSLFTYLLGVLGDKYHTKNDSVLQGRILTGFVLISYLGCIPFFLLNSVEYAKNIKYQTIITNYVAKNTKMKLKEAQKTCHSNNLNELVNVDERDSKAAWTNDQIEENL